MSLIKECFISRWDTGVLLEADFSQLEIVGVALLSEDEVLKSDLRSGEDLHKKRAAELFGVAEGDVTAAQRRVAKALSFQLQYGAGAASMASINHISKATAQKFIDLYYGRYTRLKQWQDSIQQEVKDSRVPTGLHTPRGFPKGKGTHHSPTGRIYTFLEHDSDYRDEPGFSSTEMKNYPVQGYATGDIMAAFRHQVWRSWLSQSPSFRAHVLPINTIHDSIMFDCAVWLVAYEVRIWLNTLVEQLPGLLTTLWPSVTIDLPFQIECKAGPTWAKMAPLKD